jgi:hypothetical protein
MVSRLIEKEDVSLEEHSAGKREFHLPTTGEAANGLALALIGETDGSKSLNDLLLVNHDALVVKNELENRGVLLATIDVVLDVEGANLIRRGEALDLAVGDGTHEGGLSSTVLSTQTIAVATLEAEGRSVEQDLGTISERELAVAQILAFLFVVGSLLLLIALSSRADDPLASDCDRLGGRGDKSEERSKGLPLRNLEVLEVDKVGGKVGSIHGVDVSR